MDRNALLSRLGMVAGVGFAGLLGSCGGKQTPCSGSNCLPISGSYTVVYSPKITCPAWVFYPDPTSPMVVEESGSTLTMLLQPSVQTGPVTLNGQEDVGGVVTATQPETTALLGIPYGEVNGAFTLVNGTYEFNGTLQLIPTAGTVDAGPGSGGCASSYSMTAEETSTPLVNDGGTPTDGG